MTSVKSKLFAVKKTRRIGVDAARWSRQTMGETTAEGRLYKLFARRGMTYTTALRRFFALRRGANRWRWAVFRIAPLAQSDDDGGWQPPKDAV